MESYLIHGGHQLAGNVAIGANANASIYAMGASLLVDGVTTLTNVPRLSDTHSMVRILEDLGCQVTVHPSPETLCPPADTWRIEVVAPERHYMGYDLMCGIPTTSSIVGAMLGRRGRICVYLPGVDSIGDRPQPIDWLASMVKLGATAQWDGGAVCNVPDRLRGCRFYVGNVNLTGIIRIIFAAVLAEGTTTISGARSDPELVDVVALLNRMGARITGAGSSEIRIEGVQKLHACEHRPLPSRTEAGLWMIAAAITGGDLHLADCNPDHLSAEIDLLEQMGVEIRTSANGMHVRATGRVSPAVITTSSYPGFPSDLQPPLTALLSLANGHSLVSEGVFLERFGHLGELRRMGAQARLDGATAIIHGMPELSGASVTAFETQGAIAMVLAGLAARGTTTLQRIYHIKWRYSALAQQLQAVGADITTLSSG